jgi:hypothetical protein
MPDQPTYRTPSSFEVACKHAVTAAEQAEASDEPMTRDQSIELGKVWAMLALAHAVNSRTDPDGTPPEGKPYKAEGKRYRI